MSHAASRVELLFLWHHHQPDYRSPRTGRSSLPWVRLHATKDYLDMALRLGRHERLRATFNFVPSLVDQIEAAEQGGSDALFDLLARRVVDLTEEERLEVMRRCGTPPPRMRDRFPRYAELCRHVERLLRAGSAVRVLPVRELEALEAWFLLVWIDPMFLEEPEARAAIAAAGGPGAAERDALLLLHHRLLGQVIPAYRRLAELGRIELSTSPYAHPILPLLISTSSACRARPELRVPGVALEVPEDARRQLARAIARHAEVFGAAPRGLWPSEGSVSPEVAELVAESGLRWMATDEGVLWPSLSAESRKRGAHYRPWRVSTPHGDVAMFFRDRELSDRVGFVYHHWETREAVEDFVARLRRIGEEHGGETPPIVSVILDGENCWEHYQDDGGPFLDALYDALDAAPDIATVTPSEVLARGRALDRIDHLHSGSWIDADFHIWIGHPEKNRAWELIARTRAELVGAGSTPASDPEAWQALDAAEGSDWFWWLGTDHFTPDRHIFEGIFREHLQRVYEARGAAVPSWLRVPIVKGPGPALAPVEPMGYMRPEIDGRVTSYYEWRGSGHLRLGAGGSMHRAESAVSDLYFGFDDRNLYLRLDFAAGAPADPLGLEVEIRGDATRRFRLTRSADSRLGLEAIESHRQTAGPVDGGCVSIGRIVELAVPLSAAGLTPRGEAALRIFLMQDGEAIESVPPDHDLGFVVPGREDEGALWSV